MSLLKSTRVRLLSACCGAAGLISAHAQVTATYTPNNWVVDTFTANTAWGVSSASTSSPIYTNSGISSAQNNMFGYSPIGSTITLANPGDTITLSTQYDLAGGVNSANLQFRFGLLYKGNSPNDAGWAGVLIAIPNAAGQPIYEEKIPNTGTFGTGASANTPAPGSATYVGGSLAGPVNFTLSVTYLSSTANLVHFTVQGTGGNAYLFSGRYTNNTPAAQGGFVFDTVGFLKGGSVFSSASTANTMGFSNVTVTLGKFGDGTWANDASGNWSTTADWVNGVPANGSAFIADFSQVALTANRTVTLDTPRTVGSLIFGATSGSVFNWTVAGNALTLDNLGVANFPGSIAVNQNTATINANVISTNGLTETGSGILALGGNNTIAGPLNLNGGELNFSSVANLPLTSTGITSITFRGVACSGRRATHSIFRHRAFPSALPEPPCLTPAPTT
jgi:autotransporter-associated beta strand protein